MPEALVYVAEECEEEPGDLRLDRAHRTLTCAGKPLSITPTEYRILEVLLAHGGSPVSSELIQQRVWSEKDTHSNILAVHIRNIRRKLEVLDHESVVRTVRGYGYALDDGSDDRSGRRDQDSFISSS